MSRFLPQSLFGQTLLILLLGLVFSHLVGAWLYRGDREQAVRAVGGFAAAQRVANLARLVEEAPAEWRERIVAGSNDAGFRVRLAAAPPAFAGRDDSLVAQVVEEFLARQLPPVAGREIRVAVASAAGPPFMGGPFHPMGPMMRFAGSWRGLEAAVRLADGSWLAVATALPGNGPAASWEFTLAMALTAAIILLVSVWAVRRVTRPLADIAAAAERLGRDVRAPPLALRGSAEMRQAARAFNDMQAGLRRLVENRTRMLAAISHDLRTPLTLLRLRAEAVENADERDRMLATIAEMNGMIEATLAFARDEAAAEPRRPTDVTALVASIVDDMADAGAAVSMAPAEPVVCDCQPAALRRALRNLVDNAVTYGTSAEVAVSVTARSVTVTVDDRGPGIPEAELARVVEPFYRLEASRNRATGGIGLGLAIAAAVAAAHGGELILANRREGGLRATLRLPR